MKKLRHCPFSKWLFFSLTSFKFHQLMVTITLIIIQFANIHKYYVTLQTCFPISFLLSSHHTCAYIVGSNFIIFHCMNYLRTKARVLKKKFLSITLGLQYEMVWRWKATKMLVSTCSECSKSVPDRNQDKSFYEFQWNSREIYNNGEYNANNWIFINIRNSCPCILFSNIKILSFHWDIKHHAVIHMFKECRIT